jgi:hypothetical protein
MAQTLQQTRAAVAVAPFHLELAIERWPAEPSASGSVVIGGVVTACYRAASPLSAGAWVDLTLDVAVPNDPPRPGAVHLLWAVLRDYNRLEVFASGQPPALRAIDGGVRLQTQSSHPPATEVGITPAAGLRPSGWSALLAACRRWSGRRE